MQDHRAVQLAAQLTCHSWGSGAAWEDCSTGQQGRVRRAGWLAQQSEVGKKVREGHNRLHSGSTSEEAPLLGSVCPKASAAAHGTSRWAHADPCHSTFRGSQTGKLPDASLTPHKPGHLQRVTSCGVPDQDTPHRHSCHRYPHHRPMLHEGALVGQPTSSAPHAAVESKLVTRGAGCSS